MLKKLAGWFICFGLSFLVEIIGWTEQGKAFFYIHAGSVLLVIAVVLIILVIGRLTDKNTGTHSLTVLNTAGILAIILFATWGATKVFDDAFYEVYQIMTFGQCVFINSKKKEDD